MLNNGPVARFVQYDAPVLHGASSSFFASCATVKAMSNDAYRRETVGQRLRRLRLQAGVTLEELAQVLDSEAPSRIAHYEADRRPISVSDGVKLATRLSVAAAHLLCLDNDQPILSEREQELIKNLRLLPKQEQDEFHRRIVSLGIINAPVAGELAAEIVARSQGVSRKVITKGEQRGRKRGAKGATHRSSSD